MAMPSLSLRHGFRCVTEATVTVEEFLVVVGEKVGYENIAYASRMNKAIVVFLKEECLLNRLVEHGVLLKEECLVDRIGDQVVIVIEKIVLNRVYENVAYASRMIKAVVVFLKEECLVDGMVEHGVLLKGECLVDGMVEHGVLLKGMFIQVTLLFSPSTRVTMFKCTSVYSQ